MEASAVRKYLGSDKIVGVSAQTVEEALLAQKNGADYLGVGAVFPTGSKDDAIEAESRIATAFDFDFSFFLPDGPVFTHVMVLAYYISYRISCRVFRKGVLRDDN